MRELIALLDECIQKLESGENQPRKASANPFR